METSFKVWPVYSCKLWYKCPHSLFIRCHIIVLVIPHSRWLCIAMLHCWNTSWFWVSLFLLSWTICPIFQIIWLAADKVGVFFKFRFIFQLFGIDTLSMCIVLIIPWLMKSTFKNVLALFVSKLLGNECKEIIFS